MSRYPDIGQHRSQKKTVAPDKLPACRTNPPPERILPLPSEDPAAAANTKTGKQPTARVKQPAHERPIAAFPPTPQNLDQSNDHSSSTAPSANQASQRNALHAWFHSDACNSRDGLDDYDQNYDAYHPLKNIITADMRHHIERRQQDERSRQNRQETKPPETETLPAAPGDECGPPLPAESEKVYPDNQMAALKMVSSGRLVIIGSEEQVIACGRRLGNRLNCFLLVESDASAGCRQTAVSDNLTLPLIRGQIAGFSGFLGNFKIDVVIDNEIQPLTSLLDSEKAGVDLVLDLASPPHIRCERPPWGYFAPGDDSEALTQMLHKLPDMVGEFEKPGFILEKPELCAHHRSRFRGCDWCLRSCPAEAIRSKGDAVQINHHLCQGCGLCAALCPTGALSNGYLPGHEMLTRIRDELRRPESAAPCACSLVFHEPESSPEVLDQICSEASGPVIQECVDDIGAIGMDIWFTALAYGAAQVIIAPSPQTTAGMRRAISTRIGHTAIILKGMGYDGDRVILADSASGEKDTHFGTAGGKNILSNLPATAATFSPLQDKRQLLRLAIEHLYERTPRAQPFVSLPGDAPFGTVRLDKGACTLCMACAQVCPTAALGGGSEQPQINLVEARCIQCGLCRQACPEKAITLDARMVYARDVSETPRILKQETWFDCICCQKPIAPARLVERMAARLDGHWMYRSQQERRRLKMCRECRLQDIFNSQHAEKSR